MFCEWRQPRLVTIPVTMGSVISLCATLWSSQLSAQQRFLTSPLQFADPNFTIPYSQGAYTPGIMNSILDHSMIQNPNNPSHWEYGTTQKGELGGDGKVIAFNGEPTNGLAAPDDVTCISGTPPISLKVIPALPGTTDALINGSGCAKTGVRTNSDLKYTSYDEHPGYDYKAAMTSQGTGTPVIAAAPGYVVDDGGLPCVNTNLKGNCSGPAPGWGYIGIEHPNGYITQYGHLSKPYVAKGMPVYEGQTIGLSGNTAPVVLGPHLHFEVLKKLNDNV